MSNSLDLRGEYLKALALPEREESTLDRTPQSAALARAHELRKFEIENYWKRATYFWAFQLAAFTLFGLLWQAVAADKLDRTALLIPAGLGAITAQVGWLTAKGSKFWQENWEGHVDMLEQFGEGRLTQTIILRGGQQYSVTRANEALMLLLVCGWIACSAIVEFPVVEGWLEKAPVGVRTVGLLLLMLGIAVQSRMGLHGWKVEQGEATWVRVERLGTLRWIVRWVNPFSAGSRGTRIMLRDATRGRAGRPENSAAVGGKPTP